MNEEALKEEIKSCRTCAAHFMHTPRPVVKFSNTAKILIIGQAPGTKVHNSGIPWNDASGNRLRDWLNIDKEDFYDETKIAIMPMGFCYPGVDKYGGDKPPRKECAPKWHDKVRLFMPSIKLTLLIGSYSQKYYLKSEMKENMTQTVKNWRAYLPQYLPLPHPSWRNTGWIKKNRWFEEELIPELKKIVKENY
ncbi:MAG: uracil-DNA glycosylase family protein [Alphaproteobacteria bacterium]